MSEKAPEDTSPHQEEAIWGPPDPVRTLGRSSSEVPTGTGIRDLFSKGDQEMAHWGH